MIGWIAHALEEYAEPGLRFRAAGVYIGPVVDVAQQARPASPDRGNPHHRGDVSAWRLDTRVSVTIRLRGVTHERRER